MNNNNVGEVVIPSHHHHHTNNNNVVVNPSNNHNGNNTTVTPTVPVVNFNPATTPTSTTSTTTTNNSPSSISSVISSPTPAKHTQYIKNYPTHQEPFYSDTFELAGFSWRLYIFPTGNGPQFENHLSIFLDLYDMHKPGFPEHTADFSLELVNQVNPSDSIKKQFDHNFTKANKDWGLSKFIETTKLLNPATGFLVDDTMCIKVEILDIYATTGNRFQDPKKNTGFVGLQNQGATCYMNSLLQSLFHLSPFRKAVYELPTETSNGNPTKNMALALQRLFYGLQIDHTAVSTKELTKSFGWDTMDIFIQHDVQELNRVLQDNLSEKMKGTKVEGLIEKLFRGKLKNFIKCEKVKYESKSDEYFYDLSLTVKGCKDIYQSFEKYIEIERLEGSNQYFAEGFGLQVANKGLRFLYFPPVLHLHLKRFEYDPYKDDNVKINDKFQFPEELDLTRFLDETESDKSVSPIYSLQGVLVHSGDLHNGHYYAYLKVNGNWLKFDDDIVLRAHFQKVADNSYGSDFGQRSRDTNAYMLIYLRKSEYENLTLPMSDDEIPDHLKSRVEKEREEKKEIEQTINIKLTRDEDFMNHHRLDLLDFDKLPFKTFKKTHEFMTIGHLKNQIATIYGIPKERQRIWRWIKRRNLTTRIDSQPENDEASLRGTENSLIDDIKLHLEISYVSRSMVEKTIDVPLFPPATTKHSLLFFKYYDPSNKSYQFLGSKAVDTSNKISDIEPYLNNLVHLPLNTPLLLFEELSEKKVDPLRPNKSFLELNIGNGDIIVFQRHLSILSNYELPTVSQYLTYILNTIKVKFIRVDNNSPPFSLTLSKNLKFSEVVQKIGEATQNPVDFIRLIYKNEPRQHIKPNDNIPLIDLTVGNVVYFEVLNIPVSECEFKSNFKVQWKKRSDNENVTVSVWVMKTGNAEDITREFLKGLKDIENEEISPERIRLIEILGFRISVILKDQPVSKIHEYVDTTIRAEYITDEELYRSEKDHFLQVVHFNREHGTNRYHGIPFHFLVKSDDSYASIRSRIYSQLCNPPSEKDFSRWRIALIKQGRIDNLNEKTNMETIDWSSIVFIGLDHPPPLNKNFQKAIQILG
eukprot:gene4652-5811_t